MTFFSRWKNVCVRSGLFKQDPEGRYFSICLAEAILESNDVLPLLFDDLGHRGGLVADTEYQFHGKRQTRKADVAILTEDRTPVALIEVKMEDQLLPEQLADYLRFSKVKELKFLLLSRYGISPVEDQIVRGHPEFARHRLLGEFAAELAGQRNLLRRKPVCRFLAQFLEEENMMYSPELDRKAINALMTRIFWEREGTRRQQGDTKMIDAVPRSIQRIMNNLVVVKDQLLPGARFTYDYAFHPKIYLNWWELGRAGRGVNGGWMRDHHIERSDYKKWRFAEMFNRKKEVFAKAGGYAYFFAQTKLPRSPNVYFCFGYRVTKVGDPDRDPVAFPYVELYTRGHQVENWPNPRKLPWSLGLEEFSAIIIEEGRRLLPTFLRGNRKLQSHFTFLTRRRIEK